jgi:hypothetical protein
MPKKWTWPRILLHHWPLLCGVNGNEALGLAGFLGRLRLRGAGMVVLLATPCVFQHPQGSLTRCPVVVKVVVMRNRLFLPERKCLN